MAIAELAARATRGRVYGADHSAVMVRRARRHNAAAVRAGRVELIQAPAERLPDLLPDRAGPLDAVLAVNTVGFWPGPADRLGELRRLLRPGGRIALVSQPRCPGADRDTTGRAAQELRDLLTGAGFGAIRVEILDLDPPVACVLGHAPGGDRSDLEKPPPVPSP